MYLKGACVKYGVLVLCFTTWILLMENPVMQKSMRLGIKHNDQVVIKRRSDPSDLFGIAGRSKRWKQVRGCGLCTKGNARKKKTHKEGRRSR
jgi:hypothetical protein